MTNVLISGASVAGPALAYWLGKHGIAATIVERAPAPRAGGQALDIRGAAIDVIDRMGILNEVWTAKTGMRGMTVVDAEGTELFSTTEETLTGGRTDTFDVEIMRDDLAAMLYRLASETTEFLFGDTITALVEDADGVHVTFETAAPRTFDLVIGADGLHSKVRGLVFGEEKQHINHLGTYLSIFSIDNHLGLRDWQTMYRTDTAMAMIYNACEGTVTRAMLGFQSPVIDFDFRDTIAQRALVAERFADGGWEVPKIVKAMWEAPDFYFDSMSQITMDRWSAGRVALVGDAGYCPSPLSGQGTSVALVGAYVLAGELAKAHYSTAFAEYERIMRPFVELNQRLATDTPGEQPSWDAVVAAANGIELPAYA
jgi:2-polyprenyl-6-methoxyphenol hydroxylase-like FAD-dependent oxidoreductase